MKNLCKFFSICMFFMLFFIPINVKADSLSVNFTVDWCGNSKSVSVDFASESEVAVFRFENSSPYSYTAYSLTPITTNCSNLTPDGWEFYAPDGTKHTIYFCPINSLPYGSSSGCKVTGCDNYIAADGDKWKLKDYTAYKYLANGDSDGLNMSNYTPASPPIGSVTNPKVDDNIGTLVLSKTKMYEESSGNDINDLYNLWSWKNKTNTGFSLSDNDYAQTFIQVRVESKCVVYDDLRHTKIKKNFDNYGEKAMLFESIPYDHQPLKISYLTHVPDALPLTHAENHNPLYTGYNYTLYFRVVCSNSTAVIPDSSSGWVCGGWRSVDCNADVLNGQTDKTENGHFDNDDNWIADDDDGNNNILSGSDSVHDTDDAKDNFNEFTPNKEVNVDDAKNSLKSLLEMVGYIPTMIAKLFSFLPDWCLNMLALFFASLCVLTVYKLIRG